MRPGVRVLKILPEMERCGNLPVILVHERHTQEIPRASWLDRLAYVASPGSVRDPTSIYKVKSHGGRHLTFTWNLHMHQKVKDPEEDIRVQVSR